VLLATVGTLLIAAHAEENDGMCAGCHTQPETTYVERAQAAAPVDLASSHASLAQTHPLTPTGRCIDCHAGPGVSGRLSAMTVGVRDIVKWAAGTANQPGRISAPLPDENCLKCHAAVLAGGSFDNHPHRFLPRWQKADTTAATCAGCHSSHTTDGKQPIAFLNQERTVAECKRCHVALNVDE
jgi:hypothetical protein